MTTESKTEDMWTPYKELQKEIEYHLTRDLKQISTEFEALLKQYKQNFFNLLQNSPKNATSREELRNGMTEGITVRGIGHQILSKELYQEVTIISDMYNLNEYMALDLLCTAQIQLTYHPGLTRGLVAILLYYDGRKALVTSLRQLMQARQGVSWRLDVTDGISKQITEYTDHLMNNGVFNRILSILKSMDISKEIELLQRNKALGNPKHHRQILDLYEEIHQQLADIIFMWSAQTGLPRSPAISLISYLKTIKPEEDVSGAIDNVTLTLQMALLYGLDLSILNDREDGETIVQKLPLISEAGLMEALLNELAPNKGRWECEGLQALSMFALGQCLGTMRLLPQNQSYQIVIEHEDIYTETAIKMNVFSYISNVMLKNNMIYKDKFYLHRFHTLITEFIVLMPNKVKELRLQADETSRTLLAYAQEGLEAPSNLPRHFEEFMYCISKLYSKDPLKLELMLQYWCPGEITLTQAYSYRTSPKSVSLFKFVRMAGDMMPSTLFVPYLNMLASLSTCNKSALYCFNLLKQNSAGYVTTVSWDHFFATFNRYLSNLRLEAPPVTDTVYRHKNFTRGITQQELQGLHAVLLLIKTIAENDNFSRIALCEHPVWAPLNVLLALVSCPVPIPLKAALLSTLAALSKSPETTAQMWNNLEASQVLVTIPSTSSYQPRGIQTELDEIESRMEEYPLTRALLELLDVLTDSGIPRTLGAGPRKPGFDPYLTFIINSVFLKFHTRAYKNIDEKWMIANQCLKLFEKFLSQYDPQASDFPVGSHSSEFNPPPGFHIMIQLNTKSQFLDLILSIIDESYSLFESYSPFLGKEHLEEGVLKCFKILNRGLILQAKFCTLMSNSSCTILLSSLSKLLLNLNPRTSKPDYVLKICKFIGFQSILPEHALIATKVLIHVTQQPSVHAQIMTVLLSYSDIDVDLRNGFVACLDAEDDWRDCTNDEATITTTKESIITLLKQCLSHSAPNFSHFLFGFDLQRDISKTIFQFPGVMNFPRTCLHSLFNILNQSISKQNPVMKPSLKEAAYRMLFALCENPRTYGPVLKFIKQNSNFFDKHIQAIDTNIIDNIYVPNEKRVPKSFTTAEMNQMSWLLKTIAIEQKICSSGNQMFYLKNLTKLLTGYPEIVENKDKDVDNFDPFQNINDSTQVKRINFLNDLIMKFNTQIEVVQTPQWNYFDNNVMAKMISNCETGNSPRLINIKSLHLALIEELSGASYMQGPASSQRQLISQEIQTVLAYAIHVNNIRKHEASTIRFMEAWGQLVQVIFITLPDDVMSLEEQQILLTEYIETLLTKMLNNPPHPEVANLASAVILLLIDCLRQTHINSIKRLKVLTPDDRGKVFAQNIISSKNSSLKTILQKVLQWIIYSDVPSQRLRVNLYGSLLSYLNMICYEFENKHTITESSFYVSRLDNIEEENLDQRVIIVSEIISNYGDKLIEVMCHDCIGGHDICKMLAMSSMNRFIFINVQVSWIKYLATKGFLKHLIESIQKSDNELKAMLETIPDSLRSIYLYETKMALMGCIASTRIGAEVLLEQRLLACLASMKVFNDHPTVDRQSNNIMEDMLPSVSSRYQQVLFPALDICDAILTSVGTDNRAAVSQIMYFILSHLEVIENVLQQGRPNMPASILKELALITGIIARTANNDLCSILENTDASPNDRAYLHRLQRFMLALLPRFVLTEPVLKDLSSITSEDKIQRQVSDRLIYSMRIACNLVLYARNLTANHGVEHGSAGVILQPMLNDPLASSLGKYQFSHYSEQNPTIGVVVQQLVNCVHHYHCEKVNLDFLKRKVEQISTMNSIDLKEFVPAPTRTFNIHIIREGALENITERLQYKEKELEYTTFLIENCLYLVWSHLDYYMLKSIPKTKNYGFGVTNDSLNATLISATETTWKVTAEDISSLKQGLVSKFNDTFSRKLVETTQDRSELDKGFVEALLRRLKRLIQFVPVK